MTVYQGQWRQRASTDHAIYWFAYDEKKRIGEKWFALFCAASYSILILVLYLSATFFELLSQSHFFALMWRCLALLRSCFALLAVLMFDRRQAATDVWPYEFLPRTREYLLMRFACYWVVHWLDETSLTIKWHQCITLLLLALDCLVTHLVIVAVILYFWLDWVALV